MKTLLKFLKYRVHFLLTIYNMGVEPRKVTSIYDDDDNEMVEYDEEAELDMMFPNRADDDDWDDL